MRYIRDNALSLGASPRYGRSARLRYSVTFRQSAVTNPHAALEGPADMASMEDME